MNRPDAGGDVATVRRRWRPGWAYRRLAAILTTISVVFAPASVCVADEPEQLLQEVFIGTVVYPQEKGELQFTATVDDRNGDGDAFEQGISVEYGVTEAWQLEIEWSTYSRVEEGDASEGGIGDLELGTLYSLMNIADSRYSTAFAFELGIPTGDVDRGLSDGFLVFEPSVIGAVDLPELDAHVFAQTGYELVRRVRSPDDPGDRERPAHSFFANLGVIYAGLGPVRIVGELNFETDEWDRGGDERELYATPGFVLPAGGWEIGVGVPIGLVDGADDYRVRGNVVYEFDTLLDGADD